MKIIMSKLLIVVIAVVLISGLQLVNASDVEWAQFSKNIVKALKSDSPGLQKSAMQMVIKYGDKLDVGDAVFDVMRVFRNEKNRGERRLALAALLNMNSDWATDFLKRQSEYEKDPVIKKQLESIGSYEMAEADLSGAAEDFSKLSEEVSTLSNQEWTFTYKADADGNPLNADQNKYVLSFGKGNLPPVESYWSVTMFDSKTQLQVDNPLTGYQVDSPALSDLKMNMDGGLTLYIQNESPGEGKASNWLPAPKGPFYMLLRLYWPKKEVLDGKWTAPQITKAE
jgi:hypothetical protein